MRSINNIRQRMPLLFDSAFQNRLLEGYLSRIRVQQSAQIHSLGRAFPLRCIQHTVDVKEEKYGPGNSAVRLSPRLHDLC